LRCHVGGIRTHVGEIKRLGRDHKTRVAGIIRHKTRGRDQETRGRDHKTRGRDHKTRVGGITCGHMRRMGRSCRSHAPRGLLLLLLDGRQVSKPSPKQPIVLLFISVIGRLQPLVETPDTNSLVVSRCGNHAAITAKAAGVHPPLVTYDRRHVPCVGAVSR
jgi:hypothetical protein